MIHMKHIHAMERNIICNMKYIQILIAIIYRTDPYNIRIWMKRVHSKTRKLYKTYAYNIANLKFMKQIHKKIKYLIYPNNSMKFVHHLLTTTMTDQLTD